MDDTGEKRQKNPFIQALRALWRFILLLLTGILVGGVVYFGFVQFYANAVQVSQDSTARISAAETLSVQEQAQVSDRVATLSQRLANVEKQQGNQVEALSDLQGKTTSLQQAAEEQSVIINRVSILENRLATLTEDLNTNSDQDQKLADSLTAADAPLATLQRDVQVLKAMELVSQARLNLIQNNAGLARTDVASAYALLAAVKDKTPEAQQPIVDQWLQRLNLVEGNLPGYPVLAADDLEIAWQMLANGWEQPGEGLTLTPVPESGTAIPTQTPTPLLSTPTP